MAKNKMKRAERMELVPLLEYARSPSSDQVEYLVKMSILCFLRGEDALEAVLKYRPEVFTAERIVNKARFWLNGERAKRRNQAEVNRTFEMRGFSENPEFTTENFRITMDPLQHRNYGMVNVSIYALVEVWVGDEEVEKEYLVNFSDFKTKEWLTRLMVWALMNKREILIKPASDAEMKSMRMFVPKDKEEVA